MREASGSNIWYNPIPEEEDAGSPAREEQIWKRRNEEGDGCPRTELAGVQATPTETFSSDLPVEFTNPSVSHHIDDISTDNTGKMSSACLPLGSHRIRLPESAVSRRVLLFRQQRRRLEPQLPKERGCVRQHD